MDDLNLQYICEYLKIGDYRYSVTGLIIDIIGFFTIASSAFRAMIAENKAQALDHSASRHRESMEKHKESEQAFRLRMKGGDYPEKMVDEFVKNYVDAAQVQYADYKKKVEEATNVRMLGYKIEKFSAIIGSIMILFGFLLQLFGSLRC